MTELKMSTEVENEDFVDELSDEAIDRDVARYTCACASAAA